MAARAPKRDLLVAIGSAQRAYLEEVISKTGWKPSRIARESGLSDTTLTGFLNSRGRQKSLNPLSIAAIQERTGISAPPLALQGTTGNGERPALREDATPYEAPSAEEGDRVAAAVRALTGARKNTHTFTMRSNALELAGIRSGDILVVEPGVMPRNGDVVCANVVDRHGTGETWFRIYQAPHVIPAMFDVTANKPELVDNDRVVIWGVVTDVVRQRR